MISSFLPAIPLHQVNSGHKNSSPNYDCRLLVSKERAQALFWMVYVPVNLSCSFLTNLYMSQLLLRLFGICPGTLDKKVKAQRWPPVTWGGNIQQSGNKQTIKKQQQNREIPQKTETIQGDEYQLLKFTTNTNLWSMQALQTQVKAKTSRQTDWLGIRNCAKAKVKTSLVYGCGPTLSLHVYWWYPDFSHLNKKDGCGWGHGLSMPK